jgi:CRP-like cAMP-binding protein
MGNDEKTTGVSSEFQENLDILRQIDFFSGLPLEATKVFAYLCVRETFKTGDLLFHQDDEDGRAFYVLSGSTKVTFNDGQNTKTISHVRKGEFLGRLVLMGNMRRLFSLEAESDVTCLVMSREKFTRALEQFPQVMPKMIKTLVDSIYKWEKQFMAGRPDKCDQCLPKLGVSLV